MARILSEARADLESGLAKALGGSRLDPVELNELEKLTVHDMVTEHGLDSLMAEKIVLHAQSERMRLNHQSQFVPEALPDDFKDLSHDGNYKHASEPFGEVPAIQDQRAAISESKRDRIRRAIREYVNEEHEPSHEAGGRMLDYGHTKSDSNEGRMMRSALYDLAMYAAELHDTLSDDDDLPQWCHYKIANAKEGLSKVKHYIDYKLFRKGEADLE